MEIVSWIVKRARASLYLIKELTELQFLSTPLQLVNGKAHLHWQGYVQRAAANLHVYRLSHPTPSVMLLS